MDQDNSPKENIINTLELKSIDEKDEILKNSNQNKNLKCDNMETNSKKENKQLEKSDINDEPSFIKRFLSSDAMSPLKGKDIFSLDRTLSPQDNRKNCKNYINKEKFFGTLRGNAGSRRMSPIGNTSPILNYYSMSPQPSSSNLLNYYSPNTQNMKSPISPHEQNFNVSPSAFFNNNTNAVDGQNTSGYLKNNEDDSNIKSRKHTLSEENEDEVYRLSIKSDLDDEISIENLISKNKKNFNYNNNMNINITNNINDNDDNIAKVYGEKNIQKIERDEYYSPNKIGEGINIEKLKRYNHSPNKYDRMEEGGFNYFYFQENDKPYQINTNIVNINQMNNNVNNFNLDMNMGDINNFYSMNIQNIQNISNIPNIPNIQGFQNNTNLPQYQYQNNYISNFCYNGDQYVINPNKRYDSGKIRTIGQQDLVTTITSSNKKIKRIDPNVYLHQSIDFLAHNIFMLAKDQAGCKFLQSKIDENPAEVIPKFYNAILGCLVQLIKDPFGNYFVQKVCSFISEEQLEEIIEIIAPNALELGANAHGTRVLQHLISCIRTRRVAEIFFKKTENAIVELLKELNGTHVVMQMIKELPRLSPIILPSIISIVISNTSSLASHRHGCCVLQRFLEGPDRTLSSKLSEALVSQCKELIPDQFANYVLQSILVSGNENAKREIVKEVARKAEIYGKHRYASNVVEKCFDYGEENEVKEIIEKLSKEDIVKELIIDEHGNYVIQKVLSRASKEIQNKVISYIIPKIDEIHKQPFGSKLLNKLAKTYSSISEEIKNKGYLSDINTNDNKQYNYNADYNNNNNYGNNNNYNNKYKNNKKYNNNNNRKKKKYGNK